MQSNNIFSKYQTKKTYYKTYFLNTNFKLKPPPSFYTKIKTQNTANQEYKYITN